MIFQCGGFCWQDSVGVVLEHRLVYAHSGNGHVQRDQSLRDDQRHILQVRLALNLQLHIGLKVAASTEVYK